MKVAIYLINLDGSDARLASATAQLEEHGIVFERISAVDGRKIPPTELEQLYDKKHAIQYMGRDLSPGEIGCYLSHIKAIQAFTQSDADIALVLEDDFAMPHNALAQLPAILAALDAQQRSAWDCINISNNKLKIATALQTLTTPAGSSTLYHAHYFPMLATGVLWSRTGAQKFLQAGLHIFCPYDNFLRWWQTRENRGYSVFPPLIRTTEVISDIDAAGKRRAIKRGGGYGLAKQKRLWHDKLIALQHKLKP
jgi:glycosyl transferase family 25